MSLIQLRNRLEQLERNKAAANQFAHMETAEIEAELLSELRQIFAQPDARLTAEEAAEIDELLPRVQVANGLQIALADVTLEQIANDERTSPFARELARLLTDAGYHKRAADARQSCADLT